LLINALIVVAKILVLLVGWLTLTAYMTLAERKICAHLQHRVGPNRVGPWGLLQPVADGLKLIVKEDIIPLEVDRFLYVFAPILSVSTAMLAISIIPLGNTITIGGHEIGLYVLNANVGILVFLAISSLAVYGIVIGGWSSNSKYSTLGAIRTGAQMISYELALGLAVVCAVMMAGSLSLVDIVESQGKVWNILRLPHGLIGGVIFIIAMLAEMNRGPFDLPEAEQELVAGYHTEYSSMKFGSFFVGEYGNIITASALISTLYFGGYKGLPFIEYFGLPSNLWIPGFVWLLIKVAFFAFLIVWVRWTLPRFRYDQLMNFGWKVLLPIAIGNVVLTGVMKMYVGW